MEEWPRKRLTREKLLAVAREHFAERGYDATHPHEVAKSAGVSVGTFYSHFDDKFDVFLQVTDHLNDEMLAALADAELQPKSLEDEFQDFFYVIATVAEGNPRLLRLLFPDVRLLVADDLPARRQPKRTWGHFWENKIRNWQQRGMVTEDLDPALGAYAVLGMVREVTEATLLEGGSLMDALKEMTQFATYILTYEGYAAAGSTSTTDTQEKRSPG